MEESAAAPIQRRTEDAAQRGRQVAGGDGDVHPGAVGAQRGRSLVKLNLLAVPAHRLRGPREQVVESL
jgi:hypothetical protein